jgi:IS30 family transposase
MKFERLDSWKEIAAYLNRDQRTVQRWELQRGLPVHRIPGGVKSAVYAYPDEIEAWLRGQTPTATSLEPPFC